jgi:hypothetical protein
MLKIDGLRSVEVIQVIQSREKRGAGTTDDLVRIVTKYWTLKGEFLAENDPCPDGIEP